MAARKTNKQYEYGKCYAIHWIDNYIPGGKAVWKRQEDIDMVIPQITTVGWVVRENSDSIAIASSVGLPLKKDETVSNLISIIKGCIVGSQVVEL